MTTHDFGTSLQLSQDHAAAPWWDDVYLKAFPGLKARVSVRDDGWAQRGGIDTVLTLQDGSTIKIDEKVRSKVFDDFCLEYWSNIERRIPGWVAKDLACDFIAYAFIPTRTCYLLPFLLLRRAWRLHYREWVTRYKRIEAVNRVGEATYTTVSVAVPIREVLAAIGDAMIIRWGGEVAA